MNTKCGFLSLVAFYETMASVAAAEEKAQAAADKAAEGRVWAKWILRFWSTVHFTKYGMFELTTT